MFLFAGNLLLVPLFLAKWSAPVYGEWLALFSVAAFISSLQLGMNTASITRLTQHYARGETEAYARYQHSALAFFLALAAGGIPSVALLVWRLPVTSWIGLTATPTPVAQGVLLLLAVQFFAALPFGFIAGGYRTIGRLARGQWLSNGQQVLELALISGVLLLNGNMVAAAGAYLVALAFTAAFILWDMRRSFPQLLPGLHKASGRAVLELLAPSLFIAVILVSITVSMEGAVLLISATLGGVFVTLFATSRTLVSVIPQVAGIISAPLWPEICALEAHRDLPRLRQLHRLWLAGSSSLCVAAAAVLWFEGADVIRVWTRGRIAPDLLLLRLMLAQAVLQSVWRASSIFPLASNRHHKLAWSYLAAAVLGIGTAFLLIGKIGLYAVPVGLLAAEAAACCHFVLRDACGLLEEPYGPFARRLWLAVACSAAVCLAVGWGVHAWSARYFLVRWLEMAAAALGVSLLWFWRFWLLPEDRELALKKLRR